MKEHDEGRERVIDCLVEIARNLADADLMMGKVLKQMGMNDDKSGIFCDLSLAETHFIAEVAKSAPINGTSLAKCLGLSRGGVSKMASRLADKGMVKADKIEGNRKDLYYTLLDSGEFISKVHDILHKVAHDSILEALAQYSDGDVKKFIAMICQVSDAVRASSKEIDKNAPQYLANIQGLTPISGWTERKNQSRR